jgi:ankyrin repeat protein
VSRKSLPDQPSLDQYRKQAKDLLHGHQEAAPAALDRIARYHPRLYGRAADFIRAAPFHLADAQLVVAREHGLESWPKFARYIETLRLTRDIASLTDPIAAFIEAACVPLDCHSSGTLDEAGMILARHPNVAEVGVYTAAILAGEAAVRACLARDPAGATEKGGPRGWDALTYLCFSRYLRLDRTRSEAFVRTARALLDAGASANTGWIQMIDHPNSRPVLESAIYGAAGIAQHAGLTRLLLERGADPNDEETPYHVVETRDNTVLKILLESGTLNAQSLSTLLLRKCDWHDAEGVRLVLEHGADPNRITVWGHTSLHQAVRRDNSLDIVKYLLDYGADPLLPNRDGSSAMAIAARRGRAGALDLFERRGTAIMLTGSDRLLAACARDQQEMIRALVIAEPQLKAQVLAHGGTLLAQFAGVGNLAGVRNLLDLGVSPAAIYREGDGYFSIAKESTALHVAAWRAWPEVVRELIARGAPVNATDAQGRTALQLSIKACVDSYWIERRSPDSVSALLEAGASSAGIELPTGYDEIDKLLSGSPM